MEFDSQQPPPDAEARRLTLSQLADYLEAEQERVTNQWLLAVRRDPEIEAADRLTHQQLLDHLPEIYRECCTFLRTRDAAALVEGAKNDAQTHGGIRWADGYRIEELIRELEVFRAILGGTLSRYGDLDARFRGPIEASANALIQRFFGEVTINSVSQYAQEQQAVVSTYTRQLEAANLELGRANSSLQQALSERERLTAVIAHEVRNFLQSLKRPEQTSERQAEIAHAQLRDVEELLTQLLDHSALIARREPLAHAEFAPAQLHDELTRTYRPVAQQKGLALLGSCADAPPRVAGDRLKIKQIAANLLSNALKFTEAGHVSLTLTHADAERWLMRVADSGPGLGSDAAQRLFGGVAGTETAVPHGGIGLAITKDLVDLLGGSIQVVTKAGAGTVIDVLLPIGIKSA